jgi:hypothetical protein
MASPFDNVPQGLTNTIYDAQFAGAEKVAELKKKKEEVSKTVESTLGGLKAMIGSKGVFKSVLGNPTVEKYIAQTKGNIKAGIEKAGKDAVETIKSRFTSTAGSQANPSAIEATGARESATGLSQEGAGGLTAEQGAVASQQAVLRTTRLAEGDEEVDPALEEEGGLAEVAPEAPLGSTLTMTSFGSDDFDDDEFDEDDDDDDFDDDAEEMDATSEATTPETSAIPKDDDDDAIADGEEGLDETGLDADAPVLSGADADALAGAGATGGTEGAVTGGEAFLGALDAIPGLDLFTLIAGVGLGLGAALDKRKPDAPILPPQNENDVAFQAGFSQV